MIAMKLGQNAKHHFPVIKLFFIYLHSLNIRNIKNKIIYKNILKIIALILF
jgi:hypothetical protein